MYIPMTTLPLAVNTLVEDDSLCFLLTTYKEMELTLFTLSKLREFHANSQVICLSDGVDYSQHSDFFLSNGILYKQAPHLKTISTGGLWVRRYLRTYLNLSTKPYLIKIDPDTGVYRTIRCIPQAPIFGTYTSTHIDSNSMGMKREAVEMIISSNQLSLPIYNQDCIHTYRDRYKRLRPSTDRALRDVIRVLDIPITSWSEVRSTTTYEPNTDLTYALTHPVPFIPI
jgi:hypothetical protein